MNNKFSVRLKELRKAKKLTQKELGEVFGYSDSSITQYEKGTREPNVEVMVNFADYFGVSLDYLIGRTDNPKVQILQTNFFDNEEHNIEVEYEKENSNDNITLEELEKLIEIAKKIGMDLSKVNLNRSTK